jgi:putative ABC transport system permease protein
MARQIEHLLTDIRFGARMLAKAPSFTIFAIAALALGIGANTAIFSVVNGILLRPLPFPEADRIAVVYSRFSPQGLDRGMLSVADYLDWKETQRSFDDPALYFSNRVDITSLPGEPEAVNGSFVTAGFFSTLRVTPLIGRLMQPGDDSSSTSRLVVLGEDLWRRRFGASQDVLGKVIQLQDIQATVIGVAPASFHYPPESEVWINERIAPMGRGPFHYYGLGRLKPGVSIEQAQDELNSLGRTIEARNPGRYSHLSFPVVSLRESIVGSVSRLLIIMLGAVFFVHLIAVANVANLLLARAAVRNREIVLRSALGASRGRIAAQLLTESCLLSLIAGALGIALAYAGIRLLVVWNPGNLPRIGDVHIEGTALLFTVAVSLLTGVLFGMVPALHSMRTDLNLALKERDHATSGTANERRTGNALVVAEIAFAFVLLTGAGLLLRSFSRLQQVNIGTQAPPQDVLTMQVSRSAVRYVPNDPSGIGVFTRLIDRLRHVPGVVAAGLSTSIPPHKRGNWDTFVIEGRPWTVEGFPAATAPQVSSDYFRALQIPLLKGRYFTDADTLSTPKACIISQTLAKLHFGDDDPVGKTIRQSSPGTGRYNTLWTIVGVVGDVKYTGLNGDPEPVYYTPLAQDYSDYRYWLVVRSNVPSSSLAPTLRRELEAVDHSLVVNQTMTLDRLISKSVGQQQFNTSLLFLLAVIALVLAAIGIYGVTAYSVTQRTAELGVRIALGARRGNILGLIVGHCMLLAGTGLMIGFLAALALTRLLSSLLFHVRPTDFVSFATVTLLLSATALVAGFFPGWRATRTDPITALRHE